MQRPVPQDRFHELVRAVCEGTYSVEDLARYGAIEDWDVSEIQNMSFAFADQPTFNRDLSRWNTSRATSMESMFYAAVRFNQPLEGWDVSRVTNMNHMFCRAQAFNRSLERWDVSRVRDMSYMFSSATALDQIFGGWDVGCVESTEHMFTKTKCFRRALAGCRVTPDTKSTLQRIWGGGIGVRSPSSHPGSPAARGPVSHLTN